MQIKLPFISTPIGTGNGPSSPSRTNAPASPASPHPTGLRARHGENARLPPRTDGPPRNAFLPKGLMNKAQGALHLAGHLGGPVGTAATLAHAALSGAAGATTMKQAALGAAHALGTAALKPGTPIAAAIKLADIGINLHAGKLAPRDAMVQGLGAALDLAGGLMPGPMGKVAKFAGVAVQGAAGASNLKEAASAAAMAVAGAAMPAGMAGAATQLAGIGANLMSGTLGPRDAMVQGLGAALDVAGGVMPGTLGQAAKVASAALSGMQGAPSNTDAVLGAMTAGANAIDPSGLGGAAVGMLADAGKTAMGGGTAADILARMSQQVLIRA